MIFTKQDELCVGHSGAQDVSARPGKFSIVYTDSSAILAKRIAERSVLRRSWNGRA